MNCPKCSSDSLVETLALGNIPLDVCPGCSGIWFDKGELEGLLKQGEGAVASDFSLINPKEGSLACPRCKSMMPRGGLVNPLLLVDKCQACGGVWLDARELELVKKLLGVSGLPTEVKVERPAAAPAAPSAEAKMPLITVLYAAFSIFGLLGVSYEMYLYFSPESAVSHAPSAGVAVASVLFFIGGIFGLNRGK